MGEHKQEHFISFSQAYDIKQGKGNRSWPHKLDFSLGLMLAVHSIRRKFSSASQEQRLHRDLSLNPN